MIRTDDPHATAKPVNPDADATFAAALPWVRREAERLAAKIPPSGEWDEDDLFQVGAVAAWKLAREWDQSIARFWSFANLRVHGAMIDLIRDAAACGFGHAGARLKLDRGEPIRVTSLAVQVPGVFGFEHRSATLGDMVGACDAEITDGDDAEVAALLKRVGVESTSRERAALVRHHIGDETQKEIAGGLGMSESRVSQVISGVVDRIRERLVSQGRDRLTAFA